VAAAAGASVMKNAEKSAPPLPGVKEMICDDDEECDPDDGDVYLLDDWDDGDDENDPDGWEYYDDYGDDDDDDAYLPGAVEGTGTAAVAAAAGASVMKNAEKSAPPLPPGSDPALLYFLGTSGFGATSCVYDVEKSTANMEEADLLLGSTEVLRAEELFRRKKLAEKRSRFGEDWERESLGERDVQTLRDLDERKEQERFAARETVKRPREQCREKERFASDESTRLTEDDVDELVEKVLIPQDKKEQEKATAAEAEAEAKRLAEEEARLRAREEELQKRAREEEAAAAEAEAKRAAEEEEEAMKAAKVEAEAKAKRDAEEAAAARKAAKEATEAEQRRKEEAEEEERRRRELAAREAYDSSLSALNDPATGVSFPPKLEDDLYLMGVGVRRKAIINVYSVGAYSSYEARTCLSGDSSSSPGRNKNDVLERLQSAVKSADRTSFILNMTFKASAEAMAGAIADSVAPRHAGDQTNVDELKKIILEGVKKVKKGGAATKGTTFRFDCDKDGLSVSVDRENVGRVTSRTLSGAFCDVFLDDKAVSPALRDSIYGNC